MKKRKKFKKVIDNRGKGAILNFVADEMSKQNGNKSVKCVP